MPRYVVRAAVVLVLLGTLVTDAAGQVGVTSTAGERLDRLMARYDREAPGAAVAVVKDGELVFAGGYGIANLEYGVDITPESVFSLASVSKQFTGFALAMLIAEGKLSLDDPVQQYVPELPHYAAPLLVRHLVRHTGGLRDASPLLHLKGASGSDLITHEDALSLITSQRETTFEPGARFRYSNAGYVLLSTIVERVADRSFPRFMQEEIFEPLGMTSTFVLDHHERIIPDRVEGYKETGEGELLKVVAPLTIHGSTGVYSSVEDMARWLANLAAPRVGGQDVVEIMHRTGSLADGEPLNYGFGLDLADYRGLSVVGHAGSGLGFRAYAGRVPERGLGVVVLSNGPDAPSPFQTFLQIVDIYIGDEGTTARSADPTAIARWAGEYVAESGLPVRLVASGATLEASVAGGPLYPLTVRDDSVFSGITSWGAGYRITFGSAEGAATMSLYGTKRLRKATEAADAPPRWSPDPGALSEYAGHYHSPELGVTYEVTVEGDTLVARGPAGDIVLRPKERDRFTADRWFFGGAVFERDGTEVLTGMRVTDSAFRLRGVLFERQAPSR